MDHSQAKKLAQCSNLQAWFQGHSRLSTQLFKRRHGACDTSREEASAFASFHPYHFGHFLCIKVKCAARDGHTRWSKSGKERLIPYGITYMWNLECDVSEHLWNRLRPSDQTSGRHPGERRGGGTVGISARADANRCSWTAWSQALLLSPGRHTPPRDKLSRCLCVLTRVWLWLLCP